MTVIQCDFARSSGTVTRVCCVCEQTVQGRRRLLQRLPWRRVSQRTARRPAGFLQLVAAGPRGHAGVPGAELVDRAGESERAVRPGHAFAALPRLLPGLQPLGGGAGAQTRLQVAPLSGVSG